MPFPPALVPLRVFATGLGCALIFVVACITPRLPIRGTGAVDPGDVATLQTNDEAYRRAQDGSLERNDRYTLAFLEFDSSGRPGDGQVAQAAEAIRQAPGTEVLVVLFVHGWGHSADARDPHVVRFRETLCALAADLPNRSVVGIYVSWPAKWLKGPLHFLTYLDRSIVAQRLGGEDCTVREELRNLRLAVDERRRHDDVLSIAVGHSLGGQFLFSYMEECLDDDPDESCGRCSDCPPSSPAALPPFGDLVLLVNPAQDTNDFENFRDFAENHRQVRPVVAIFSSEADLVVGRAYRVGRTIRNVFWPKYWDDSFKAETIGLGWNEKQLTHVLCSTDPYREESVCSDQARRAYSSSHDYGTTALWSLGDEAPAGPFFLVRVDRRVVGDHGDMFNPLFRDFLRQFVAGMDEGASGREATGGAGDP